MIKVIIADDHQVVRRGLRQLITEQPDLEVVGECVNGREVINLLENGLHADVLLSDVSMPDMDGLALAEAVNANHSKTAVILLTIQEEDSYIQQAFSKGVKGYLFKTAEADEVIFAIRQVASQHAYIGSGLSDRVVKRIIGVPTNVTISDNDVEFSERELEVLKLISSGFTNEETADKLFTSRRTVEGHRQSMIDKTGSRNSLALIAFAVRNGLLL